MVHGLDVVFSIAANSSCYSHHENREAWKKGNTITELFRSEKAFKIIKSSH